MYLSANNFIPKLFFILTLQNNYSSVNREKKHLFILESNIVKPFTALKLDKKCLVQFLV